MDGGFEVGGMGGPPLFRTVLMSMKGLAEGGFTGVRYLKRA